MDLVTLFLKTINSKGAATEPGTGQGKKKKTKKKASRAGEAEEADDGKADAEEASMAAGASQAAKAMFESMKAKMRGAGSERKHPPR